MTSRKRQNAEIRKPVILRAFYEVIDEEGFENASIAKVAARAGIHPSLIIHYFKTKEKMVMELVDDVLRTYAGLFERLDVQGTAEKRLENLLRLIWSREWYEAANFSVVFSFLALSQRNGEVEKRVRRLFDRYKRFITCQLTAFAEAGVIRISNPETAADILISMSEGSHYFCKYHNNPEDMDTHRENMMNAAHKVLGSTRPGRPA